MNAFLSLGRWIFTIPFALFGLLHFMDSEAMVQYVVPSYLPAKIVWVYLGGAGLIAASVSMLIGKYDKLAATLLAIFFILVVFMVHMPKAMMNHDSSAVFGLLKDISLAGAAMMYAQHYAVDRSVIG